MIRSRLALFAAAAIALAPLGVHAQTAAASSEVVSTAPATADAPPTTQEQIKDWVSGSKPLAAGDEDGVITGGPDRRIHGEVGVYGGNRGYGGYGAVSGPLGQNGYIGLAVGGGGLTGRTASWGDPRNSAGRLSYDPLQNPSAGCAAIPSSEDRYADPAWLRHVGVPAPAGGPDDCLGAIRTAR